MQSSDEKRLAHNERMKIYMREYRKRRRIAKQANGTNEPDSGAVNTPTATVAQSSPVEAPGAP